MSISAFWTASEVTILDEKSCQRDIVSVMINLSTLLLFADLSQYWQQCQRTLDEAPEVLTSWHILVTSELTA